MQDLLRSFYTLTNIRVGLFDLSGKEMLAYPIPWTDYCRILRSDKQGDHACRQCDREAFAHMNSHRGIYMYQCHAGLTEVLAPIISSGGERAGYLMIGQMRQPGSTGERQWAEAHGKIKALNLDMEALRQAYAKLLVIKRDQIRACANILQALASYVLLDNYIRIMDEPLSSRVKRHITANLRDNLSLPSLAKQFGVGKTTLCGAIKRDCQLTVNELIRYVRVERAKELLRLDKQPISAIAEQVGIPDYNYFAKIFKEETGVPPSLFRKLCEGEYRYKTEQLTQ